MIYIYDFIYAIYFKAVLKWKKKKTLKQKTKPISPHFFLSWYLCVYLHLTGRKWKKSVSPWPSINVLTWGCYKGIWTLKPFYDHYQLIGPLGLFLPSGSSSWIWADTWPSQGPVVLSTLCLPLPPLLLDNDIWPWYLSITLHLWIIK